MSNDTPAPIITGREVTCTDASRVVAPDAEIEPTDDDARTAARELSYFVPRDAEVERRVTPNGIPMLFVDCTTKGETVRRIARITRDHALDVARERLAAQTPAPVSQDSAEKQLRAEIQEHVLRCVDDNQNTLDSMEDSVVSLCREYAARLAPQDSAPRAMPPEIAAFLASIRHRMSNLGLGVSPDEVVWLLDALEAAYAPRDESAGPFTNDLGECATGELP